MPTKPTTSTRSTTARANGAKSRGPTTAEGRARSSRNALRHGLTVHDAALPTVSVVLDNESPADFQRLLDSYLDEFAPTSPIEVELIETMVSARWRLRRLANIETTLLGNEMETTVNDIHNFFADVDREPTVEDHLAYAFKLLAGGASLHLLNRYEGTIGRSYARAFKQLQQFQALRNRPQPNEPKPAPPPFDTAPTLPPVPPNKVNEKAQPATPPVLQTLRNALKSASNPSSNPPSQPPKFQPRPCNATQCKFPLVSDQLLPFAKLKTNPPTPFSEGAFHGHHHSQRSPAGGASPHRHSAPLRPAQRS